MEDQPLFAIGITLFVLALQRMRDADKSLARLGRKKATATKLGIYSAYSPRSSIHFLARCSNFCKPLKKIKIFVPCIFIMLIFFYQQTHFHLTYKTIFIKIYIKTLFTVTPTCFCPFGPSSGSLY